VTDPSHAPGADEVPPLPWWTELLQLAVRRGLDLDPLTREGFARLDGRVICVDGRGGPVIWLKAGPEGLRVVDAGAGPAQLTLRGTPFALLRHLLSGGDSAGASGVTIEGDASIAQQLQRLVSGYRPDFEEEVAKALGDVPARHLGNLFRDARGYTERLLNATTENLGEYLREESRAAAPAWRVREFLDEVDRLRADVERLELRIRRLGG
jgi:ubiquinone biosynthesis protein UbiJ